MQASVKPSPAARRRRHQAGCVCVLALGALTAACDSPPPSAAKPHAAQSVAVPVPVDSQLASARIDLAQLGLSGNAPDEALALLVSALEADPQSAEARTLTGEVLAKTRWHLPELTLDHHQPIDRIDYAAPSSLWVCLSGASNTTVRWDLESPRIASVLFPIPAEGTRSLVFSPTRQAVVIERAGVTLLCNAQSLKPIRDLGPLPDFVTPSAVIVFSADGLLLAHPAFAAENDHALVWHLRDSSTGEIIRSSKPAIPERPRPLAAFLDRRALHVLHTDGSLMEMPVSPVEAVRTPAPEAPVSLLHAQFAANGGSALTLKEMGPHRLPEPFFMSFGGEADPSLEPASLLEHYPWNRHPGLWTGLLRDPQRGALEVDDRTARVLTGKHAPVHTRSAITAVAASGDRMIVGEQNGTLTVHRTLPVPLEITDPPASRSPDDDSLAALRQLTQALAGCTYDATRRSYVRYTTEQRIQAFHTCDFTALARVFPTLDFSPLVTAVQSLNPTTTTPESLLPLTDRLARSTMPPADLSYQENIRKAFSDEGTPAILDAIKAAGGKGPAAAMALELALASTHPDWIEACLTQAADLPPLLRRIAVSRAAWLQERKADALTDWPEVFPDLQQVRLREDWDGWEQADFSQALAKLSLCLGEELANIEVPPNSTPEQRTAVAARLNDPATMKAVGRARFAKACLKAALALAAFKDETATTLELAARARDLGEDPAPCLRAEAISLTALGDYQKAHDRWITLITEHPVASQLPGDYAEAAYTSFENADPRQAMAVLTTGLHRFPNDGNFALRAGWVALLTGNSERAYRFLLTGRQIGFPPEKLENATALLAIAAEQTGAAEDAAAYYQDLILLDPAWANPETLESLEWPEELKASLRQLVW